jgi:Zn/Cd-binding protein ZinT
MEARVVAGAYEGAWVEVYKLLEDGTVTKVRHEGGTPEAERLRAEARRVGPAF